MATGNSKSTEGKKKSAKKTKGKGKAKVEKEPDFLARNSNRSFALKELWYQDLMQAVDEQIAPEPNKREMLFLTVTNAVLDMVMDVLPEDLSTVVSENIDDYIAVTLANRDYGLDILKLFQEEFLKAKGNKFETEEELDAALSEFQDKFWDTPRKDLNGKSPNDVVGATLKKFSLA